MTSHVPDDPTALDHALEVSLGRRAPFAQVGDWVLLSGADSDARTLYWALSAHLNTSRDDNEVWPGLLTLARILGLKKPENVSKYMLQLEVIGAVEVIRSTTGLVRRNRYIVHQTPPVGYCGPRSMADWYALNRAVPEEIPKERDAREEAFDAWLAAARQTIKECCQQTAQARALARKSRSPLPPAVPFLGLNSRTPTTGGTRRAGNSAKLADQTVPLPRGIRTPTAKRFAPPGGGVEVDQEEQHQESAPAARSVASGRRPHTASSRKTRHNDTGNGRLELSAPRQGQPPRSEVRQRMTQAQAQAVEAVEAGLPEELRALLPPFRPATLRDAILREHQHRTVEELIARADRRWYAWGFASTSDISTGGAELTHPVGAAIRLIASHRCPISKCGRECPDPRCEDGVISDTSQSCPRCAEHRSDHRNGDALQPGAAIRESKRQRRPECRTLNASGVPRGFRTGTQ
ncbi:hypothetical protein [Streptomyces sp. NBC_00847]|uniref:hypothetical protein n=1 Tax=Streptomyces sp. NBC_00847 TaxID=2975850 RepID=UPI00225B03A6|nr:hypothetical protein [Streptomyces sp. NBC_00847]MCX4881435.1 hypothetical protein [Streptomyces sp. NBC_00847]